MSKIAYGALKRELAGQEWADMNAYSDAKGRLIAEVTARAEEWELRVADPETLEESETSKGIAVHHRDRA